MAARYAVANFTVGNDYVWVGSIRDSASPAVVAYPAGFQAVPMTPGTLPPTAVSYLVNRPAGP
jgi:hypothetical protein